MNRYSNFKTRFYKNLIINTISIHIFFLSLIKSKTSISYRIKLEGALYCVLQGITKNGMVG